MQSYPLSLVASPYSLTCNMEEEKKDATLAEEEEGKKEEDGVGAYKKVC